MVCHKLFDVYVHRSLFRGSRQCIHAATLPHRVQPRQCDNAILKSGVPHALHLCHLLVVVIAGSILARSSTDVLVARWIQRYEP